MLREKLTSWGNGGPWDTTTGGVDAHRFQYGAIVIAFLSCGCRQLPVLPAVKDVVPCVRIRMP